MAFVIFVGRRAKFMHTARAQLASATFSALSFKTRIKLAVETSIDSEIDVRTAQATGTKSESHLKMMWKSYHEQIQK